ncbi:response regulator [Paenibacillus sp. MMS20-IR301]|uniref:response regulator n=1 Tax=Paenibacillus sp. MMS20-IR301 TaxID=2895946 RepID=UPI0028EB272A|nr:response regulator [Paenibacillus sp. MMS20-IR301]WNS44658.1 response regulator [Paenibacillus sp. MMS20-IR301]
MHRVIIVEDEFIVRYGIRSMINWEAIGLEVSGEASNGREALELMTGGLPDILITDIKMPVMDGIELIAEVRKLSQDIKIIILSNLEDFQYAKEAIRHSVSEYMIKSDMMPRDFELALLKLKEGLEGVQRQAPVRASAATQEPVHKENFLTGLIERGPVQGAVDESRLAQAGLAGRRPHYLLHVSFSSGAQPGYGAGSTVICKLLDDIWGSEASGYEMFPDRQGNLNIILTGEPAAQSAASAGTGLLRSRSEELIQHLASGYGWIATIGISGVTGQWAGVGNAYIQAVDAVRQKLFTGNGCVLIHGSEELKARTSSSSVLQISSREIQSMVYAFQTKELTDYLNQLFGQLAVRRDTELVQIITLELLMILTTLWPDVSRDAEQVLELKKQYFDELAMLETLEESQTWFLQAFDELARHMKEMYNSDRNSIIKATQYIQQYYHQEITLRSISRLVHLSKNYFANLFRKEVGESFLEYLTRIRIEKAKTLLTGELKAGDVGSLVGIQDPKYFSKVFKKITGVSPSEYRGLVKKSER